MLSKFENNRSLLIPFELFQRMGDDLLNIFTYNNVYIYNIEPLRKLFITRSDSGHVRITDKRFSAPTSLADLIYVILAIRLQIAPIKDLLTNVVDAEDSQSRALKIWSRQVSKVQKASAEDLQQARKSNYLNRAYVYEGYKSIINIMEISRYQGPTNNLVNDELREVSIGTTAILTSPEKLLKSILAKPGNMLFLISATGGISGDLSTSYDMSYLEDNLRDDLGRSSFRTMTEQEIQLCETIRHYRQQARQIFVNFFNRDLDSMPNAKTKIVVERFEKTILKNFIDAVIHERGWLGIYKVQELKNFIRFVFYLFEDDSIQETFALTQTLQWIRSFIQYCQQSNHVNEGFEKFRKTQLFHYQNLMNKLEEMLNACGIAYEPPRFQATHYLENSYIKNVETVKELEIINNFGVDLSDSEKAFLKNFLKYQGIPLTTFYRRGKTISTYEPIEVEDKTYWKINPVIAWDRLNLDKQKNYLVLNKLLEEETGSMAYLQDDGLWNPSDKLEDKKTLDFYSQLMRRYNYLSTGEFISMQGLNINDFKAVGETDPDSWSIVEYSKKDVDLSLLHEDTRSVTKGQLLSREDSIYRHLIEQHDAERLEEFCKKYGLKVSPEFEKILIEIGIKSWIKDSLLGVRSPCPSALSLSPKNSSLRFTYAGQEIRKRKLWP